VVTELPAGYLDPREAPEDCARRELLEETGYEAGRMERLFDGVVSAGLTDEAITFYLAHGCKKVGPGGGDGSEEITVHEVPLAEVLDWIVDQRASGKQVDVKAMAILAFWLRQAPGD